LNRITGIPASPGIAIGPVFLYLPVKLSIEKYSIKNPIVEWTRLEQALTEAETQLKAVYQKALQETGSSSAEIFQAQLEMLRDPELLSLCRQGMERQLINIEAA